MVVVVVDVVDVVALELARALTPTRGHSRQTIRHHLEGRKLLKSARRSTHYQNHRSVVAVVMEAGAVVMEAGAVVLVMVVLPAISCYQNHRSVVLVMVVAVMMLQKSRCFHP